MCCNVTFVISYIACNNSGDNDKDEREIVPVISVVLIPTVLVTTIDAQWEGMGDVGSARYEPTLLPPCPTIRVLSYSN